MLRRCGKMRSDTPPAAVAGFASAPAAMSVVAPAAVENDPCRFRAASAAAARRLGDDGFVLVDGSSRRAAAEEAQRRARDGMRTRRRHACDGGKQKTGDAG
jgi:hypothetical protein